MALSLKLPFFSRGEISPRLYGRVDAAMYQSGLKTARNAIVGVGGGIMNRPGTIYIGTTKYADKYTRLVPFAFKTNDTHMLEFGDQYMRVIREDKYQTELSPKTIVSISKADPAVVTTSAPHGYSTDQEVVLNNIGGMTEFDKGRYKILVLNATQFTLRSVINGGGIDSTNFGTYTSGGTADRIYEIVTPYLAEDLPLIKWAQSADVLTIVHPNYPPKELKRFGLANWEIDDIEFAPSIDFPTNVDVSVPTTGTDSIEYQVTAIDRVTGIESLPGWPNIAYLITSASNTDPVHIETDIPHGLLEEDEVEIIGVSGMTELNNRRFRIVNVTSDAFDLLEEDGTGYGTFTPTADANVVPTFFRQYKSGAIDATITWSNVEGAAYYAVYRRVNGLFSYIGETEMTTFRDNNLTPNSDDNPPQGRNPFLKIDTYPGAVGFYQQRRVFGGSNLFPDTWYASQPGDYANFSRHSPLRDDDSITATLSSGQVNQIKHFVPTKILGMFTTGSDWAVSSGGEIAFSPFTVRQDLQTNWGVSEHRPAIIGQTTVFVQEDNRTVRSFGFDFDVDGYRSSELSLLSDHIFDLHAVRDWAFARSPYSAMFITRTDGAAACMVFNEEQSVVGWTRFDTKGTFETVGVVRVCVEHETPEPDDGVYFTVKRTVNGTPVQFVERLHKRRYKDIRDCFFVDCGRSFDKPMQITNIDFRGNNQGLLVTAPGHGYQPQQVVSFSDIEWEPVVDSMGNETNPAQLNDTQYIVFEVTTDTFTIKELSLGENVVVAPTTWSAYVRGGVVRENINEMYNLEHLEGQIVSVLADSYPITNLRVANGRVTLPGLAGRVHVGLPYTTDIETLPIEPVMGSRTMQGKRQKVSKVTLRLEKSRECLYGPTNTQLFPMKRAPFTEISPALFTGDREIILSPDWRGESSVFLRNIEPLPFHLLAIFPDIEIGNA